MTIRSRSLRWIGIILLVIGGSTPLLELHNRLSCRGCAIGISYSPLLGYVLAVTGLLLISGMLRHQPQRFDRIQDLVFAVILVAVGIILFFRGWRLDPLLSSAMMLLAESTIYWIFRDIHKDNTSR